MRPRSLEIDGFTAFRDRQVVDFSQFELFVITGPTGAGKTSLLDAIALSLYGQVPRMGRHGLGQLVSHGKPEARVLLEFEVDGDIYRASRRLPRQGAQHGRLERSEGGRWVDAVERGGVRAVNDAILDLVKLDFESFCKAILLPQGEFARFLRGEPAERRQTLVALLGLRVYERMGALARERAKELRIRGQQTRTILDEQFADATPAALADAETVRASAAAFAGRARMALADARAAEQARKAALAASQTTSQLASRAGDLAGRLDGELDACRAAEQAKTTAATWRQQAQSEAAAAAEKLVACESEETAATERFGPADELARLIDAASRRGALEARVTQAHEQLNSIVERQATLLTEAEAQTTRVGDAEDASTEAQRAETRAREARDRAVGQHDELGRAVDTARSAAQRLQAAEQRVIQLAESANGAAAAFANARDARAQAERLLEALQREHTVAHVAVGLAPGDPCPVCARPLTEPPTVEPGADERLAAASEAAETTRREADEARAREAKASADAEVATARASETREALTIALASYPDQEALALQLARALDVADTAEAGLAAATAGREAAAATAQEASVDLARARERLEAASAQHRATGEALQQATTDREGVLNLLRGRFGDHIPADATTQLDATQAGLTAAIAATRAAREQEAGARARFLEAEQAVQQSARELAVIDVRLGELRAAAAEMLDQAHRLQDGARLDGLPQPADTRDERAATLAAWCRTAAATLDQATTGYEQAAAAHADEILGFATALELPVEDAALALAAVGAAEREAAEARVRADESRARLAQRVEQRAELEAQVAGDAIQIAVLDVLGTELRGDHFIDFVVQETLDVLAVHASHELLRISNERYSLVSDQGNFSVVDHVNADEARSVKTLSGGETFMASLSLALALSKHVTELAGEGLGARLEAVFIDEGFGSLDPETLDEVIDALERLRDDDLLIGVISHVPALAERIQVGLRVKTDGNRSTTETVGVA